MERNTNSNQTTFRPGVVQDTGDLDGRESRNNKVSDSARGAQRGKGPGKPSSRNRDAQLTQRKHHKAGASCVDNRTPHSVAKAKCNKNQSERQTWRSQIDIAQTRLLDDARWVCVKCPCGVFVTLSVDYLCDGIHLCDACHDARKKRDDYSAFLESAPEERVKVVAGLLPDRVLPDPASEPGEEKSAEPEQSAEPSACVIDVAPYHIEDKVLPSRIKSFDTAWYHWFVTPSSGLDLCLCLCYWGLALQMHRHVKLARVYLHAGSFEEGGSDWVANWVYYSAFVCMEDLGFVVVAVAVVAGFVSCYKAVNRLLGYPEDGHQLEKMAWHRDVRVSDSYFVLIKDQPRSVVTASRYCPELAQWVDQKHPGVNWQVFDTFRRVKADN